MEILGQYKGVSVVAKPASSEIDLTTILTACDEIDQIGINVSNLNKEYQSYASFFEPKNLSVDGKSFMDEINTFCDTLNAVCSFISTTITDIRNESITAYNNLQRTYNDEASLQDRSV